VTALALARSPGQAGRLPYIRPTPVHGPNARAKSGRGISTIVLPWIQAIQP